MSVRTKPIINFYQELSAPHLRGGTVAVYEIAIGFGMFIAPLVDFLLKDLDQQWRYMVAMPIVPSVMLLLAVTLLPESPRWLIQRGLLEQAIETLKRLRNDGDPRNTIAEAEAEFLEIWSADQKNKSQSVEVRKQLNIEKGTNEKFTRIPIEQDSLKVETSR